MSLKPLRRRRDSRATEHSERPDGLPMGRQEQDGDPLPRRLSYRPPCRASDPQAWATYQRDHSIFSSLQTPFGSLAATPADTCSHLNYGDDAVINRPNENDRAGNLVREEAMILELGQVTIKQARYRIKRR
jgi:hypothetical protein